MKIFDLEVKRLPFTTRTEALCWMKLMRDNPDVAREHLIKHFGAKELYGSPEKNDDVMPSIDDGAK